MNTINNQSIENKEELLKLMRELDFLNKEITYHLNAIETRKHEIIKIENEIMKLCNHNWVVDYVDYDHTVYKCSICHL
jgi:hypothetical protein